MKANYWLVLPVFALGLLFHADASTVLYSTFGPAETFIPALGYRIGGGAAVGSPEEVAAEFTPVTDGLLTQLLVAVYNTLSTHGDSDLVAEISMGQLPGAPIDTFSTSVAPGGTGGVYTLNSNLQPLLLAGQPYWIVLSSNDLQDNFFGWNINNIGSSSILAGRSPGQSLWKEVYNGSPAFAVLGLPVLPAPTESPVPTAPINAAPETSTLGMLATGLLLVLVGRKGLTRCGERMTRTYRQSDR
jgi:hypothetical protein